MDDASTPLLPASPREEESASSPTSGKDFAGLGLVVLFIGLAFAVFVGALDETIVAVAAVTITSEFESFSLYSWVSVSYLVAIVAAQPLYGSISNVLGRKGPMLFAASIFLLASAGCGWASSMPFFIAARALSGIGAGGMTGLSFIIVADTFPLQERPKYMSILMSAFGTAAVTGPIIGGVFTKKLSWRWCFWINLPIVGFTLFFLVFFFRVPSSKQPDIAKRIIREPSIGGRVQKILSGLGKIDWLGVALLVGATTCFVLPVSLGGNYWAWSSPQIIFLFIIAFLSLIAFIFVENRFAKEDALIPPRMMMNTAVLLAWANMFFYSVLFTGFLFYIPIWFQVVQAHNPTITGLLTLPFLFALVIVGIFYAQILQLSTGILSILGIHRLPPRRLVLHVGSTLFLLGIILVATMTTGLPIVRLVFILLTFGAGSGLVLQTTFFEAQAAVSPEDIAVANSLIVVFEYLGGAVGITIAGTVDRQALDAQFRHISRHLISSEQRDQIFKDPELVNRPDYLSLDAQEVARQAFAQALLFTFKVMITFAVIVFLNAFFFGRAKHADNDADNDASNEEFG